MTRRIKTTARILAIPDVPECVACHVEVWKAPPEPPRKVRIQVTEETREIRIPFYSAKTITRKGRAA